MNRFSRYFIPPVIIAIGSHFLSLIMPWWTYILFAVAVCYFFRNTVSISFITAFFGVFLAWFIYGYFMNSGNSFTLSSQMGNLFGGLSSTLILLIAALMAALLGGLGGIMGALLRPKNSYQ